jgi:CRISPR-associated protein Cas1
VIRQQLPNRARPLKAALAGDVSQNDQPDYLPARMVNEFVYCPRLFYYEWVEGVFAHSADTVEGAFAHARVDDRADPLPPPDERATASEPRERSGDAGAPARERAGGSAGAKPHGAIDDAPVAARSVSLSSETHGVIATIDLVEGAGESVTPVDYKKGAPRDTDDGPAAWPADRVQVGVQALVLREHGYRCDEAILYYAATKQRVRIPVDQALVAETRSAIDGARIAAASAMIPPPLVDSPKCPRCSLVGICLPDETTLVQARALDDTDPVQPWLLPPAEPGDSDDSPVDEPVRRLVPARDDLRPLYVIGQGLSVGRSGEVLQVKDRDRKLVQEARLHETSQVNLFGNVSLTSPALQALCGADKPIAHFSSGGWFYGMTQGLGARNAYLRAEQFRQAADPVFCRAIACHTVAAKIRNQRTLLQRNHIEPPREVIGQLRTLALRAEAAAALESLLGIEGTAARLYFGAFAGMIKVDEAALATFAFEHRNRRPPRDPVNALLSLAYSLLSKDLTIVCAAVGLDPFWGFYHQPRFGRPALALDLMEMFRPLVADSVVLSAVNTGMVNADDFVRVGGAVSMTPTGRKGLLRAYEQRMDALVTHPIFDYRVSYRRVLEIQARLLARFIAGEIETYPTFETR